MLSVGSVKPIFFSFNGDKVLIHRAYALRSVHVFTNHS